MSNQTSGKDWMPAPGRMSFPKRGRGLLALASQLNLFDSVREETEAALLGLIDRAAAELGISDYEEPPLPR